MSQDYNDRQELQQEVVDKGKDIETLGGEQKDHQEDLESLQVKLRMLQNTKGVYIDSNSNLQNSVEIAIQARESSVEVCKEKITVVKVEIESKLENLNQKIEKERDRTTQMEQVVESLNHRNDGVVNNIEINIQQSKDDIEDATDKGNSLKEIIVAAGNLASAAVVGANVIGQIVSGLQSIRLFR